MSDIKLVKLDLRHYGNKFWKYYIPQSKQLPLAKSKTTFYLWREWCWAEWGGSKELHYFDNLDLFDDVASSNSHWCWSTNQAHSNRIYLRGDLEASIFTLRWT